MIKCSSNCIIRYSTQADDDVFIRLEALSQSLKKLERSDLYYGFVLPCTNYNPYSGYMSGMGFVLSWDLVQWIAVSDIPAQNQVCVKITSLFFSIKIGLTRELFQGEMLFMQKKKKKKRNTFHEFLTLIRNRRNALSQF